MRFYLFAIIFILSIINANASWQTFQNDLRNTGSANGTGYFPLATANFSNGLYGMDFQPLVNDINNDGYNELIIFSNDFLKVFDYELNLIDEKFTGTTLGQPTIFNNNLIFNSRINDKNYFFAYKLNNSTLQQKFNITLSNDADFGGIKCLNLNGSNSCIFKDKLSYIHIINIDSKTDENYTTSIYNETRQTVPAIGDIDNDGNPEAVFWFNNDSGGGYGFLAFDLNERKIDWIVDNMFTSALGHWSTFILKGQPVLVDLNNDNKLEIAASVFYDDSYTQWYRNDWFTELFVYAHNGTKLFSKCEIGDNCNEGSSVDYKWEGTNPFVLDSDKNGVDEICFIKDKKRSGSFKNMTINCYNYSGNAILDLELSPSTDTVKTAIIADMNNDGIKEIVTENKIYANGTAIFSHDLSSNFVIPVDVDGNNHLDLVWAKNSMMKLFIDDTGAVKVSDVLIKPENPSVEDSLSCQWKINANNKIISANVSWYKNNKLYSSEEIQCINSTLCLTINNIPISALNENDVWKCSVIAFEGDTKSLPKSDTALTLGRNSEWTDFNKNRLSYGIASGNGYFSKSAINSILYNSYGTEFQPMIADIDNNGQNEIVVFSNNSLIVLNKSLALIAQKQVGNLRGQFDIENMDNDAFIEIIAVINNSDKDNFTIFEFNGSSFKIETSFDISSQNGFQDIRCLDFDKDNSKECIFRDFNGIVHSYQINATSQNDDGLNINISDAADNVYGSKVNIAPSFVDFDRDADLDALFWFNDNFVVVDSNKNIALNVDVGTLNAIFQNEPAFLGLKFVNLDKAGNYEIAVAYKRDYVAGVSYETNINLSLFNVNGKIVFSRLFDFGDFYCYLNDNRHCLGFGSDLFVYDYNRDGFDDIGIYVEGTYYSPYGTFIKFFDRNGNEIASNKVEFIEDSSTPQSVTLADMDNDNELELILKRRIYNLDGTVIYNFSGVAKKVPIAVDIDKNKALDLLWFNSSNLILLLDNNSYKADLSVEEKGISFSPLNSTSVLVTANVHNNGGLNLDNVKIKLTNTGTMESANGTLSIKGNSVNNFTAILSLKKHDKVLAQVDYGNSIEESTDDNNFASREFMGLPYVFVSADNLEPFNVQSEFKNYIKNKLASGYYTENENEAGIKVYIGKFNPRNQDHNIKTLEDFEFGYDFGNVIFNDKIGANPYAALVGAFKDDDGKVKIMIVGNEIEGDIAGAKEFIKNQATLLNVKDKDAVFVDDENADAVKVYDYLHLGGNQEHYNINNEQFKTIVKNALNDEMFNVFDKSVVSGNGITLRLRNLKPNISNDYLEYLNSTGVPTDLPVVLAHGLFSNLTTWEVLGAEISNTGRDTWLIEITGGPSQDCDDCIDYTFYNLTDIFVPALLNGVLDFTGKDKIQYVGFSNGCRAALDSLERGQFDSNKVEMFVAVGCPGGFEGFDIGASGIKLIDDRINRNLQDKKHISFKDMFATGIFNFNAISKGTEKISMNLWRQYDDWINSNEDKQPGNITVNNFVIIHGNAAGSSDIIVTVLDEKHIYNNTKINDTKRRFNVVATHIDLDGRSTTKNLIRKSINKEKLSFLEKNINLIESDEK